MIRTPGIKKAWIRLRTVGLFFYLPLSLQMSVRSFNQELCSKKLPREMEGEDVGWDAPEWLRCSPAPQGGSCPTGTLLSRILWVLLSLLWLQQQPRGVFCRSWSGTRTYSPDRMAGSSGGGSAGSRFMIPATACGKTALAFKSAAVLCWWGSCFCGMFSAVPAVSIGSCI